jgi:hypothetical protein
MAQNPFDQLAKQYLEEFLAPLGQVVRNLEVPGEAKFIDVFFEPYPEAAGQRRALDTLGLLGRIVQIPCSLEPFHNAPQRHQIRACYSKVFWLQEQAGRRAKQAQKRLKEAETPRLWILAALTTRPVLKAFEAKLHKDWPQGVYLMPEGFLGGIIALDQLPETEDTLLLRILGRGKTLERAIQEVLALPQRHPYRSDILRLVANWRVRIDLEGPKNFTDQETIMAYSQVFLDWEKNTQEQAELVGEERGKRLGEERGRLVSHRSLLQRQLARKLGALPDRLGQAINLLTTDPLEDLALELLDFLALADLEAWLLGALRSQYQADLTAHQGAMLPEVQAEIQAASLGRLVEMAEDLANQITTEKSAAEKSATESSELDD